MRRAVPLTLLAAVTVVSSGCDRTLPETGRVVNVDFSVSCVSDTLKFRMHPYTVKVPEGDGIAWRLVESPGVRQFEISRKSLAAAWPYDGKGSVVGDAKAPATVTRMKRGQLDRRFAYNVSAACVGPDGDARRIVIDPDIIIIRGFVEDSPEF